MAMKKKTLPPKMVPIHYPPIADNYAGFFGVFPSVAVAYCMKKEN